MKKPPEETDAMHADELDHFCIFNADKRCHCPYQTCDVQRRVRDAVNKFLLWANPTPNP